MTAYLTCEVDAQLMQEALALSGQASKASLVEAALKEYIQRRKQLRILDLFGTIEYAEDYDYKQQRQVP